MSQTAVKRYPELVMDFYENKLEWVCPQEVAIDDSIFRHEPIALGEAPNAIKCK